MSMLKISLCDICGKRMENFEGRMLLLREIKNKSKHIIGTKTERSWRLCKICLNKIASMRFDGDIILQDLELILDKQRMIYNQPKILKELK